MTAHDVRKSGKHNNRFVQVDDDGDEIKYKEVSADLKDGVLEITLPKKNSKQRKKIQIK